MRQRREHRFRCSRLLLFLFCPILFLLRIPPCKLPLSFLALEKRLYLREQDMSQGVHFMDRYPGVVVVALLFPRHISAWRTHFSTTRTRRPGIMNTSRKDKGGGFGPRFSVRNPCVNLTLFFGISIQYKEAHNATRNPRNDWESKKNPAPLANQEMRDWWRRGESNPRPKTLPRELLRAQTVIYIPLPWRRPSNYRAW